MLKPLKRSGGRRYYRPADVELVETIDRLVNREGYTLKGAKSAIREGKGAANRPSLAEQASSVISVATNNDVGDVLAQLKSIRSRLEAALEA
jgi:DNA-binding transcriptional MerR regulator